MTDSESSGSRDLEKVKLNVKLDGMSLNRVSSTKFVGVIIDENLTWKNHIDSTSKTVSRNIGMLTKLKHFVAENILYSLYCSLILPYINYGVLIWGNTCKTYLDKIFKLQKWAIRTISNSHYRSHTGRLFSKFNILNVHVTFKLNLGIFRYRHHSNQLSPIFSTYFTKHVQIHNYPTRNAQDYSINKTKAMFSDCAIRNCGPTFWNSLEKTLKQCKTTKHFRNQMKSFYYLNTTDFILEHVLCVFVYFVYLLSVLFCKFVETFVKGMIFLRPLCPFDHVLNIMLCFLCLFVLLYDIGIKFDMI